MFSTSNKESEERIGINIFTGEQVKQPAKPEGESEAQQENISYTCKEGSSITYHYS